MDILDDDFYFDEDLDEDVEEVSINDELKQHIDEICQGGRQYICSADCEFYKLCYKNSNRCIKQIFADILDTLTPREATVLKLRCGLYDRTYKLEEIAGYYSISRERIRQIEAKALRKLRHPSRSKKIKKYIHDASAIEENFYFRLLAGIFGGIDKQTINESRLGFDFLIIDSDFSSHNILSIVLKELEQDIIEFTELAPYIGNLKLLNITSLNHLLHIEQYQLLSVAFENDDVKFFDLKRAIKEMGYRFKDEFYGACICDFIKDKFYKIFCDESLLEEKITDIQIGTILKLLELDITTYGELLEKIGLVTNSTRFSEDEIEDINLMLYSKGLLFGRHNKTYLTTENIDGFLSNLINQMVSDRESIFLLIEDLTKEGKKFSDAISYIQGKYSTLKIPVPPVCTDVIEVLDLSVRTYNALIRADIRTIEQLISLTDVEIKNINNLGEKSIDEIKQVLLKLGLKFGDGKITYLFDSQLEHCYINSERFYISASSDETMSILKDIKRNDIFAFFDYNNQAYSHGDFQIYCANETFSRYDVFYKDAKESDMWVSAQTLSAIRELVEDLKALSDYQEISLGSVGTLYIKPVYVDQILSKLAYPALMNSDNLFRIVNSNKIKKRIF